MTIFSNNNFEIFDSLFASSPGKYTMALYGRVNNKDRYTFFDNFDDAISKVVKLTIVILEDLLKLMRMQKELKIVNSEYS